MASKYRNHAEILDRNRTDLVRSIDLEYCPLWDELITLGVLNNMTAKAMKVKNILLQIF